MKIIVPDNKEIQFDESFNILDERSVPFVGLLKNEYDDFSLVIEEKEYGAKDLFELKVKIKKVGIFAIFFDKDTFADKDRIFADIKSLADMQISKKEDGEEKVNKLFALLKDNHPLFIIYSADAVYALETDFVKSLCPEATTFYLRRAYTKQKRFFAEKKVSQLIEHYGFILASALLLAATGSLGIFNVYAGNTTAVIFFVCALVGAGLNGYVYYDFLKEYRHRMLTVIGITTPLASLAGLFGGVGLYYAFLSIVKERPETMPSFPILLLISVGLILLSVGISYIVLLISNKKKK